LTVVHEPREIIPVHTPLGFGHAIFIEFGEFDTTWTVAMENQTVVSFPQEKIRISRSYTHGRGISDAQMRQIIKPKASTRTPKSMGRMLRTKP
jgi:hypothetical protein